MKKFKFRLESLLKIRRSHRDRCRQALAGILRQDHELLARRSLTEAEYRLQIDELRLLGLGGNEVDVDASAARRHFAVQLTGRIGEIDRQRGLLARQIDVCREALVRADQAVKALENLSERQLAEFVFDQQRAEAREIEETWQAIHAREHTAC